MFHRNLRIEHQEDEELAQIIVRNGLTVPKVWYEKPKSESMFLLTPIKVTVTVAVVMRQWW